MAQSLRAGLRYRNNSITIERGDRPSSRIRDRSKSHKKLRILSADRNMSLNNLEQNASLKK